MDSQETPHAWLLVLDNDILLAPQSIAETTGQETLPPTQRTAPVAFPLVGERWLIGRDSACQIRVRPGRADISRRHATIRREGPHFLIEDHSSYGTLINGQPLKRAWALIPGDMIGLATSREMLRFEDHSSTRVTPSLTEREREVLLHLAAGKLDKEIAAELSISPLTVNTYLKRIYEKLDAHNRTEAVSTARFYRII